MKERLVIIKYSLSIISIFLTFHTQSIAEENSLVTYIDQEFIEKYISTNSLSLELSNKRRVVHRGTDSFQLCQKYVSIIGIEGKKTWKDAVENKRNNRSRWNEIFKFLVAYYYNQLTTEEEMTDENLMHLDTAITNSYREIGICEVFLQVTSKNFLKSDKYITDRDDTTTKTSIDEKIECRSAGIETIDFTACNIFRNAYSTFYVGNQLNQTKEVLISTLNAQKAQSKASDISQQGNTGDIATQSLRYQKESIETQVKLIKDHFIINTTKATIFGIIAVVFTNEKDLISMCQGEIKEIEYQGTSSENTTIELNTSYDTDEKLQIKLREEIFNIIKTTIGHKNAAILSAGEELDNICSTFIQDNNIENAFLMNTKNKSLAKQLAIKAGIDAAANLAIQKILKKRIDLISGIIDRVKGHKPIDTLPEDQLKEEIIEYCKEYPKAPECKDIKYDRISSVKGIAGQIGGDGFGENSIIESSQTGKRNETTEATYSKKEKAKTPHNISTVIKRVNKSSGGLIGQIAPVAEVKSDPNNQANSSNSSSASAGGLPGGGSSGASNKANKGKGNTIKANVTYTKGKKRRGVSISSNRNTRRRKSQNSKRNPFSSLINKKGSKTLNFRRIASTQSTDKKTNLFVRISKRYGKIIQTKKKLIEYKVK